MVNFCGAKSDAPTSTLKMRNCQQQKLAHVYVYTRTYTQICVRGAPWIGLIFANRNVVKGKTKTVSIKVFQERAIQSSSLQVVIRKYSHHLIIICIIILALSDTPVLFYKQRKVLYTSPHPEISNPIPSIQPPTYSTTVLHPSEMMLIELMFSWIQHCE